MRYPKTILLTSLFVLAIILLTKCTDENVLTNDPRGPRYAAANTCANCHKNIADSYIHNNHYKTSTSINDTALGKNVLANNAFYFQDSSYVHIEKNAGSFYQTYFINGQKNTSNKFDIAFGSGEKAQTYASWQNDKFLQLPLTFFTTGKSWANSPGFPITHANFTRVVESRCFECHASNINKEMIQSGPVSVTEKLDRHSIVLGIDCQRCHGPAAEHVTFQQQNPTVKEAKFITPIRLLGRQQKLDMCAICHSGNDQSTQRSLFTFKPGDSLSNFLYPDFGSSNKEPDVHGKQMQLLQMSLCYRKSQMTCNTCHSAHNSEKNEPMGFIAKCMDCHQNSVHASNLLKEMQQPAIGNNTTKPNCIDCHMPLQPSKTIFFNTGPTGNSLQYLLRTHKIAVYK